MSLIDDVAKFHVEITKQPFPTTPVIPSQDFLLIRYKFQQEENDEFFDAAMEGDMVGVADGLADLIYVAIGTAHLMGIPLQKVWDAVQRANMKKQGGATKRNPNDAVKPPGWVAPNAEIAQILGVALENDNG